MLRCRAAHIERASEKSKVLRMSPESSEGEAREKFLFLHLIHSFENACLMGLGKVPGFDGECKVELEAAAFAIDMLDMVRARTKKNLSEEEERYLESILSNLKLNYLAEKEKQGKAAGTPQDESPGEKPDKA
jgi:hypothetical protein